MLLHYIVVIFSYLLYQAALGGLFFVLAKTDTNNPLITTTFLMVEPIMMLLCGLHIAKLVDTFRVKFSSYIYVLLATITFLGFFCLYFITNQKVMFIWILFAYGLVITFFMFERIYRQRLPRDFANSTGVNQSRINAITNLANRGAPILSPLVLYIFPSGLNAGYFCMFMIISILSTLTFFTLTKKLTKKQYKKTNTNQNDTVRYKPEQLGIWHVWHLFLLNLVLGGLFMVLSQSILENTNILHFLKGPSLYFSGFWVIMLVLMILPQKNIITPIRGLYFTAILGLLLIISSYGVFISIFALAAAGLCYGLAINHLGAFIQSQLDHTRYSYYETRAQMFGRVAALIGLTITGLLLKFGVSTDLLRAIMGIGVIISAWILTLIFQKYVSQHINLIA